MKRGTFHLVWLGLLALAGAATYLAGQRHEQDMASARARYIETNHAETERYATQLGGILNTIHQDLNTLAWLPSVRGVDRHAQNLSEEARVTFQQIYNNLAEDVLVSEVYVIPITFNPDRIDPETLRREEPIIAFDQLIVDSGSGMSKIARQTHPMDASGAPKSGVPEIEDFEYQQLVEQIKVMKAKHGQLDSTDGVNLPMISGSEVITCDNTDFIHSHDDKDRSGIILSVPFYDTDGAIKGLISAIIRTDMIASMLPSPDIALVNAGNGFVVEGNNVAALDNVHGFIMSADPAPHLAYSEVAAISVPDVQNPWRVWAGKSSADFLTTSAVKVADANYRNALIAIAAAFVLATSLAWLVKRNIEHAHRLAASLQAQRDLAEVAERDAQETAAKLAALNDNVSALNRELAQKLQELADAQDEIVRKGRMAQLGQLVATVAHEIRNPLGSVRTTLFVLKRKMKGQAHAFESQFTRIESGITRCDAIITQLLDFSRSQVAAREATDLAEWLPGVVTDEASQMPSQISVQLILPEGRHESEIDKERLRRCIVNLMANSADALRGMGSLAIDPQISIELKRSHRGTEISIADNGPGIPAEVMAKIGEPLFTTKSFGTGLGIAATRKVAELHEGGLDVSSEPGKGACFTLWFPDVALADIRAA